ncbi:MAG: hypothetical protein JRI28_07155 [Deltaproteobacteria bacterium]|nr:hypothetical protein [Deltaproteobacteria bacterium]
MCGKYREAALAGRLFSVANQAAVATTANLTAAWTGLGVCNPEGSGKNLIIHEFGVSWSLTGSTAGAYGLMTSDDKGFTDSLTAKCAMHGTGASVAYCSAGCTVTTPILERVLGHYGTGNTNLFTSVPLSVYQIDGSIILAPDRSVMTYTSLATTGAAIFHFLWEEVDA